MNKVCFVLELAKDIQAGKSKARIVTRDGHSVRIVCWDAKGDYPLIGLIDMIYSEFPARFTAEGRYDLRKNVKSSYDLLIKEGGAGV